MANVYDVAFYILRKKGAMTAMKLQKLVYYAQAWSAVWDEAPLFRDRIEAWTNGPVAPRLYAAHKGMYMVHELTFAELGNDRQLTLHQKEMIDVILDCYGNQSTDWLIKKTHEEAPWRVAREGLDAAEHSNKEITCAAMAAFYGTLY